MSQRVGVEPLGISIAGVAEPLRHGSTALGAQMPGIPAGGGRADHEPVVELDDKARALLARLEADK